MPRGEATDVIIDFIDRYDEELSFDDYRELIDMVKNRFGVSRYAAKKRIIELGWTEVRGVYTYCTTGYVEDHEIESRLREIDDARNDYINLIASGVMDEEAMDEQFQKLYAEEQELNSRLKYLGENNNINDDQKSRISQALHIIDNSSCELAEYKDMLIRKLIECVKVNSKTEITIIFKGGYEVTAEVEK